MFGALYFGEAWFGEAYGLSGPPTLTASGHAAASATSARLAAPVQLQRAIAPYFGAPAFGWPYDLRKTPTASTASLTATTGTTTRLFMPRFQAAIAPYFGWPPFGWAYGLFTHPVQINAELLATEASGARLQTQTIRGQLLRATSAVLARLPRLIQATRRAASQTASRLVRLITIARRAATTATARHAATVLVTFPPIQPPDWSWQWPVKKTPVYATLVQTPASGVAEFRMPLYRYPRWQFELDVSYLKGDFADPTSAVALVLGFWARQHGRQQEWFFNDPYDNTVTAMAFGTGDGVTRSFPLTRTFNGCLDRIQNLNGAPTIAINGVTQSNTTYTVSPLGVVTFNTAPANGAALTWSGSFFFRCRFNDDALEGLQEDLYQIWSLGSLKFISCLV